MTKRSNPGRSVPHPPGVDPGPNYETGAVPVPSRSTRDFAGGNTRRMQRRSNKRAGVEPPTEYQGPSGRLRKVSEMSEYWARSKTDEDPATRIEGTNGSLPVSRTDPKPPPLMVLYADLAEIEDMPQAVYGQYPRGLIGKMLPWLQCQRHEILHVCSGSLPPGEGIRVDMREAAKPDILADGRHLPLPDGSIAAVMLDPPYTPHYAKELYGVEYPRPSHLLREAARVVRPGGRICFVHYITPKPPAGTRIIKAFGLSTGFDMPIRAVCIYERDQESLAL